MNAAEIIREISLLPAGEKGKVVDFVRHLSESSEGQLEALNRKFFGPPPAHVRLDCLYRRELASLRSSVVTSLLGRLSIIYQNIRNGLVSGDYLQIDETPIRYLDTDRKGKSHKGYFWVFGRPEGDVCFDWTLG